jgi:large subunit ribosomal protein L10
MPTAQKEQAVDRLTTAINQSKAIVLADFTGIDVVSVTKLRDKFREAAVDYRVVKNRLAKIAVEAAELPGLEEHLTGPTAMAFAQDDPLAPAQVLQKFIDDGGRVAIKTGVLDGQILSPDQVKALASLPSRDELLGKAVGTIQGPLFAFVGGLNGLLTNLVGVLSAIEKKQQEG